MTERHTALYRLLSESGRLLYVGISGNPDSRWGTHSNNQPWWEEVADRKIEWFDSREAASAAEIEAIKEERPLYNKQHSAIAARAAVPSQISTPMEDPWADSGPADRLPASRRRGNVERNDGGSAFGLVPPQDLDAEQSVLGCMMQSNEAVSVAVGTLTGDDFYEPSHQTIYSAILGLHAGGHPVDRIIVAAELTKHGHISKIGGTSYLHALVQSVPTALNAEYYAEIVYERAVMRRMIVAGARIAELGHSFQADDANEMLRLARAELDIVAGPLRAQTLVEAGRSSLLELTASSEGTTG